MRLFNQNEKKIIQQLVDGSTKSLMYLPINVFNDILQGKNVGFIGESPMELVFPYNKDEIPSTDELLTIYNEVLERALLIDYLEKEGLIYIIPTSSFAHECTTIGNVSKLKRITMQIDKTVGEILLKCINRPMYVSETLKDYVNSGFKSLEEQALEEAKKQTELSRIQTEQTFKQTKYGYWAVILAFIALTISLFQTCSGSYNEPKSTEVTVPINAILNYMQNNLDSKLNATINNTAEIKAKLCDSIAIKNPCNCKKSPIYKVKPKDNCVKYIRINTCQDTIISKLQIEK